MQIVCLDGYTLNPGDNPWDEIEALGELTVYDRTPRERIVERAAEADVVLTNKTPLDAGTIRALPKLGFIAVLATGYNVVDIDAARERGIPVSNVPVYGTDCVAQHVFAVLLAFCHGPAEHDAAVRDGQWRARGDFSFWLRPITELAGLTMAVVGFGRIGRRVGELAHAFGMNVIAHDPRPGARPAYEPFAYVTRDEAFERGDVVSLHCLLNDETEGMVDAAMLRRMKPTAYLINVARGPLVVEADLAAALNEGRIAGASVDVLSSEPPREDDPLLTAKNCLITPHIAWAAVSARRRLMQTAAANVRAFIEGAPTNVVN